MSGWQGKGIYYGEIRMVWLNERQYACIFAASILSFCEGCVLSVLSSK